MICLKKIIVSILFLIVAFAIMNGGYHSTKIGVDNRKYYDANLSQITDANLKACIREDNEYTEGNESSITVLDCSGKNISSAEGIASLTGLKSLNLSNNKLTSISGLSSLTSLEHLLLNSNQLSSIDVSGNTALVELNVASNKLSSLDVSHNTGLLSLYASSNSNLSSLSTTNNSELSALNVANTSIKSVDISHNKISHLTVQDDTIQNYNLANMVNYDCGDMLDGCLSKKFVTTVDYKQVAIFGTSVTKDMILSQIPSNVHLTENRQWGFTKFSSDYGSREKLDELSSSFVDGIYSGQAGSYFQVRVNPMWETTFDVNRVTNTKIPSSYDGALGFMGYYEFRFVELASTQYTVSNSTLSIDVGSDSDETILRNLQLSWSGCSLKIEEDKLLVRYGDETIAQFRLYRTGSTPSSSVDEEVEVPNTASFTTKLTIVIGILTVFFGSSILVAFIFKKPNTQIQE